MGRTDSASRVVNADVSRVFDALLDPEELRVWLPPQGVAGRFERFDPRPGGSYRLVLTYEKDTPGSGKATADSDIVEARFVDIVPDSRIVQAVEFVSDDPAFAGTMTMTSDVVARHDATQVTISAMNVTCGHLGRRPHCGAGH